MERKPLTLGKISFTDLKNGNFDFEQDKNSCVIMGLSVQAPDMKELQDDATEFFQSTGFVTNDAYVVRMLRVTGNVKGDNGRWDWVVIFDKDPEFNCVARLHTPDTKWICDFVVNYEEDYFYDGED